MRTGLGHTVNRKMGLVLLARPYTVADTMSWIVAGVWNFLGWPYIADALDDGTTRSQVKGAEPVGGPCEIVDIVSSGNDIQAGHAGCEAELCIEGSTEKKSGPSCEGPTEGKEAENQGCAKGEGPEKKIPSCEGGTNQSPRASCINTRREGNADSRVARDDSGIEDGNGQSQGTSRPMAEACCRTSGQESAFKHEAGNSGIQVDVSTWGAQRGQGDLPARFTFGKVARRKRTRARRGIPPKDRPTV